MKTSRVRKLIKKKRKILRPSQQRGFVETIEEEPGKRVDKKGETEPKKSLPKLNKGPKGKENNGDETSKQEEFPLPKHLTHVKRSRNSFERKVRNLKR